MKCRIPIAREGWPFIFPGMILLTVAIVLRYEMLASFLGIATLCIAMFFRDPERKIRRDDKMILSPADGRVLQIVPLENQGKESSYTQQISIFMSVFNCHINRVPLSGKIITCEYHPGQFLPAFREKASDLNEKNTVYLENDHMKIGIRQIAGLIARRIVCRIKPGDLVNQGSRFGLIRFGSRVDLLLPSNAKVIVNPGQKVKAGLSHIAQIK